ncbi:MAG: ShlB/FhaC/HecB family hemolysin secretion/activation protein [Candidatus Xenobiia bacterium LiM19]
MGRFRRKRFLITLSLMFLAVLSLISAAQGDENAAVRPKGNSALSIEELPSGVKPVINSIVIKGNSHYRQSFLRRWLESAIVNGTLNRSAFKRSMMLINDLPDLEAEASFIPSAQHAAYDLILNVLDRRNVHFRFTCDNFGTVSSGENRLIYEMSLSSLLSNGDNLMMKLIDPIGGRNSNSQYYVTYSVPINTRGTRMSLAASSIDTMIPSSPDQDEMESFDAYELIRNSEIYTLLFTSPVECSRYLSSSVISGITAKHYGEHRKENLFNTDDEVRFLFFGFNREEKHGPLRLNYSLQVSQGLGTLLGGMDDEYLYSRREMVSGRYTRLSGSFQARQNLGKRDYFNLRGAGQISNSRLAISEEFPIGGADSVRGYAKNEYRGDDGFYMNVEYHHQLTASGNRKNPLEAVLFYDFGSVRTIDTLEDELSKKNLQGAGLGFRIGAGSSTDIRLDCGWPLEPPTNRLKRNPYIYTQMTIRL